MVVYVQEKIWPLETLVSPLKLLQKKEILANTEETKNKTGAAANKFDDAEEAFRNTFIKNNLTDDVQGDNDEKEIANYNDDTCNTWTLPNKYIIIQTLMSCEIGIGSKFAAYNTYEDTWHLHVLPFCVE